MTDMYDIALTQQPWPWVYSSWPPSFEQQCAHCYCQPTETIGSAEHPVEHVKCHRCGHEIAKQFLSENQRSAP